MASIDSQNIPFTQIANTVLYDKTLSLEAKGMFAYLFSKPENWQFSSERIILECLEGLSTVKRILRELESAGYLTRTKQQTGRVIYSLKYSIKKPKVGIPTEGNPSNGFSHRGKLNRISNTDTNNNTNTTTVVFNWDKTREDMMKKEGSDMDIIATFLDEKKLVPATSAELTGYIKRYRKVAKDIAPFLGKDFERFWKAVEMCKEESRRLNYEWNLETIYKKITKI